MDANDNLTMKAKLREAALIEAANDRAYERSTGMMVVRCRDRQDLVDVLPQSFYQDTRKRWTIRDLRKVA